MRRPKPKSAGVEGGAVNPPRFAADAPGLLAMPHQVEHAVQRELLAHPRLHFASLVVRRIDNGVCLQGVLEADDESPDVSSIAQRIAGVQQVLNRLVIAPRRELPAKG
ncbi:MAG: BON domain-containing protein [Planctomycetaceae bacterium]